MSSEPSTGELVASEWFVPSGQYSGEGRATFSHPAGAVVGPCLVRYDGTGACTTEMTVRTFDVQGPSISITKLLAGAEIVIGENGVPGLAYDTPEELPANVHCDDLTVRGTGWEAAAGASSGVDSLDFSWQQGKGATVVIRFKALHCTYRVRGAKPPRYWVMPLTNLLTDFAQRAPSLDDHPLRIYPTPRVAIPPDATDAAKAALSLRVNEKNQLIVFQHHGSTVFIESLPDYAASKTLLEGEQQRRLLTSVMVGDVDGRPIAFDDIEGWAPFYALLMLSLATGNGVESPWVEFRDDEGRLVQRTHVHAGFRLPFGGRAAIKNGVHTGIGRLLARACAAPRDLAVIRACQLCVQSGPHGLDRSEVFADVARALDGLTEHFGFASQNLLGPKVGSDAYVSHYFAAHVGGGNLRRIG